MGYDEIRTRSLQGLRKRLDASAYRLGIEFGPTLPSGAEEPRGKFFFSSAERQQITVILRDRLPDLSTDILRRAGQICAHEFDLLGYRNLGYSADINWHLDPIHHKSAPRKPWYQIQFLDMDEVGDHKLIWELSRHQHLVTLAKAYCLSGEDRFVREIFRQWHHWQRENPYPIGINWSSSLEVAFRALSWLWVRFLLPSFPKAYEPDWSRGLLLSARHIETYLSTYFAPNTHLIGEGVALFAIGTLYPQSASALRWRQRGWAIIVGEAERQVGFDGVHIEQSTYYHVYALDFFLHARTLAVRNGIDIPARFDRQIQRMLEALRTLAQAGSLPRFGDDDGGRVFDATRNRAEHMLDPLCVGAALYGRADLKASSMQPTEEMIWLLGPTGVATFDKLMAVNPLIQSAALPRSGLYVMVSSDPYPRQLIIDAGPQGMGNSAHGHADALSISISAHGREWLTDPGTFCYISKTNERNEFRGTAAHNTLQVDDQDQSVPGGPFVWTAQPEVSVERWNQGKSFDLFLGKHTGFCRLPEPVVHRRWVFNLKCRFWLVRDLAEGSGEHKLDLFWHFASDVVHPLVNRHAGPLNPTDISLKLLTCEMHGWSEEIKADWVSPCYGSKQPSLTAHFTTRKELTADFATLIAPAHIRGRLTQWPDAHPGEVQAYRFCGEAETHDMLFADRDGVWQLGPWMGDARFLYHALGSDARQHLVFCGGSFLEFRRTKILQLTREVEWFECSNTGAAGEFSCSDRAALSQLDFPIVYFAG